MDRLNHYMVSGWFSAGKILYDCAKYIATKAGCLPCLPQKLLCCLPCTPKEVTRWWSSGAEYRFRCVRWYLTFIAGGFGMYEAYKLYWDLPKSLGFFVFVLSVYTIITVGSGLILKFPKEDYPTVIVNKETAIIIPTHMSSDISLVLDRILLHFPAENVFIADNADSCFPPYDSTRIIAEEYGVNYSYYPIPCKTNAMVRTAEKIPEKFRFIMCLDDDTLLPETPFAINAQLFTEDTAGITYLLRVYEPENLLQRVIQYEFLLLSWRSYFKSRWSTMKFLPGIIAVWRRNLFHEIYNQNPCRYTPTGKYLPFGEDGWSGYIARKMGYTLKIDLTQMVYTRAPPKLCCGGLWGQGYGSSTVWKQRAMRWYRNYLRRLPMELWLLITYLPNGRRRWEKKAVFTLDWFYGLFLILGSLSIPVVFAQVLIGKLEFWIYAVLHAAMYGSGVINGLWMRWYTLRGREELAPDYRVIFTFPFFTTWIGFARLWGSLGSLLYYTPCVIGNFKKPDSSVSVLPEEYL